MTGGEFTAIWNLVQTGGVGAVFALMWWIERQRANKERDRNHRLMEMFLPAVSGANRVLSRIVTGNGDDG